jgi:hypothetical protein
MIRIIFRLLGIKDFDECKSCETLKEQLLFEREEKKRLTDTLLQILNPKVQEAAPVEVNQIAQSSALFSRRRAVLEARDREEAKIKKMSPNIGKPDNLKDINELEKELGIEDSTKEA